MAGRQRCIISHHIHKENLTNTEEYKIDVTVVNDQKMECELKGTVNMKLKGGKMIKLTDVLFLPQASKNVLIVSSLVKK